jgi:hypothetical protein
VTVLEVKVNTAVEPPCLIGGRIVAGVEGSGYSK